VARHRGEDAGTAHDLEPVVDPITSRNDDEQDDENEDN